MMVSMPHLCFLVLVAAICPSFCLAWGKLGHEIIANVAWNQIKNETKEMVRHILTNHSSPYDDVAGSPLASIANWADRVRYTKQYHWSSSLHFIDIHDNGKNCSTLSKPEAPHSCQFDFDRDCPNRWCVAGAISNYSQRLQQSISSSLSLLRRGRRTVHHDAYAARESLAFLTHFVGDIHQPLHVARRSDRGGNSIRNVTFPDFKAHSRKHWTLHAIWDDAMIENAMSEFFDNDRQSYEIYIMALWHQSQANGSSLPILSCADGRRRDCTIQWAQESVLAALAWAYPNVNGKPFVPNGAVISYPYFSSRFPVMTQRLLAAGIRLAYTLESIFLATTTTGNKEPVNKKRKRNRIRKRRKHLNHRIPNLFWRAPRDILLWQNDS